MRVAQQSVGLCMLCKKARGQSDRLWLAQMQGAKPRLRQQHCVHALLSAAHPTLAAAFHAFPAALWALSASWLSSLFVTVLPLPLCAQVACAAVVHGPGVLSACVVAVLASHEAVVVERCLGGDLDAWSAGLVLYDWDSAGLLAAALALHAQHRRMLLDTLLPP